MKKIFIMMFSFGVLINACKSNGGKVSDTGDSSTTASSSAPHAGSDFVSYTINGKQEMITGGNLFINGVTADPQKASVNIKVTDFSKHPAEVIKIVASSKGATSVSHYSPSLLGNGYSAEIMIQNQNHYADTADINISQLTDSYTEGTFSGKFTGEKSMQDTAKETVTITDGKFHLSLKKE